MKLVNMMDLKSIGPQRPCRFKSDPRYKMFKEGDKFVYFSKYGGTAFGVVETILLVNEKRNNVWIKKFMINGIYDSTELYHYTPTHEMRNNKIEEIGL